MIAVGPCDDLVVTKKLDVADDPRPVHSAALLLQRVADAVAGRMPTSSKIRYGPVSTLMRTVRANEAICFEGIN